MKKNEFIQHACLELVPAIYQQRLNKDSAKTFSHKDKSIGDIMSDMSNNNN